MATKNTTTSLSLEQLLKQPNGKIILQCEYSFHNPDSANGPLGTIQVTIVEEEPGTLRAFGLVAIQFLYDNSMQHFTLNYDGFAYDLNAGSNGALSIVTPGSGVYTPPSGKPVHITTDLYIVLEKPGFQSGMLSAGSDIADFQLSPVSVNIYE
jgi:hypothetical protein